jgi:hypothetical protein
VKVPRFIVRIANRLADSRPPIVVPKGATATLILSPGVVVHERLAEVHDGGTFRVRLEEP